MKVTTNNSILFTLLYKILYDSASKIYIFINSHITKTFRMSFFHVSQESYQRDCYITFAGKQMPWVHSNDDNFFFNEPILTKQNKAIGKTFK